MSENLLRLLLVLLPLPLPLFVLVLLLAPRPRDLSSRLRAPARSVRPVQALLMQAAHIMLVLLGPLLLVLTLLAYAQHTTGLLWGSLIMAE